MNVDLYLRVREKEGRLYSDELVARLPSVPDGHPLANEWGARSASASRLTRYLARGPEPLLILDLGCGNGWLANYIAASGHRVLGMDGNRLELRQAARVFLPNPNLHFLEADIFSAPFPFDSFDVILLASVIQYFPDLPALLDLLLKYLKPRGEIHIIDSPLYSDAEIDTAKERTRAYYASLGFPEMAEHYFHHRFSELNGFTWRILYRPRTLALHAKRLLRRIDSPFFWVVTRKPKIGQVTSPA
ncbi:MAG: class I SAM-dependent methyltransferase [Chloroflexota bacterium]